MQTALLEIAFQSPHQLCFVTCLLLYVTEVRLVSCEVFLNLSLFKNRVREENHFGMLLIG